MARTDPLLSSRFLVEIDGVSQASFSEVTIPEITSDPIEYRNGDEGPTVRKIPGLVKYSNIVLKWGMTDSMDLFNWYKATIQDGGIAENRKNVSVVLLNEKGEEAARWNFVECWPTKYDAPDTKATDDKVSIERVEIAVEGMERVK